MNTTTVATVASFAAVLVTFLAAHQVADYWVQTHHQAGTKGGPGWTGRLACARHVATYTATLVVMLGAVVWVTGLSVSLTGLVVGQLVSAVTHYFADRRTPLHALACAVGNRDFWNLGAGHLGSGAAALDQSWHTGWLWLAALLTVAL
ncbi:transcriptional regulator [Nocardia rhamnosiphila]|uniref:Transcriptional regulator n=1 Tax=Nocardia rhamnosiphila TaxID=426716 RepID=A0ABV2WVB9_9NOCA